MSYLLTQLAWCLIGALVLGGLTGWLLYQWLRGRAWGETEGRLRTEIDKFRSEAGDLRANLGSERGKLQKTEGALGDLQGRLTVALAEAGLHKTELAKGGLSPEKIVSVFSERRKTDPELTAEKMFGGMSLIGK